jgi:nucleoside-diphosphate-sugar epimerase
MYQTLRASTPLPKSAERLVNGIGGSLGTLVQIPANVLRFATGRLRPFHGVGDLIEAFYHSLEHRLPPPVSVAEATPVVEWTERIAQAADREHAQRLARLRPLEDAGVLVTGASGALGSAVVKRLCEEGKKVRIFARRVPDSIAGDIEVAIGDLGDPTAVDRAVRGAKTVIHCGAAMKGGWPDHLRGTIVGTRNVLDACRTHGVRKLVHISSLSVVDWAGSDRGKAIDGFSPLEPHPELRGAYTRAKLEAERLVVDFTKSTNVDTVILRPGQIFGGRIPLLTPAIARKLGKRFLVLGDGELSLPLVYMDDVVDAIIAAIATDVGDGNVIQLVDPQSLTQNEVLAHAAPNASVIRVPRWVVFLLGRTSEFAFRPLRRQSPLSAYRLRSALARLTFDGRRAEALLHWRPRVGVSEGVRRICGGWPTNPHEAAEEPTRPEGPVSADAGRLAAS